MRSMTPFSQGVFTPFCKKKAVLSIETAMVLPVFTMSMIMLLSIPSVYYIHQKMDMVVHDEANIVAIQSYDENAYSTGAVQAEIVERIGKPILNSSLIKNGSDGLDFSETDLTNPEIKTVSISYCVSLPFDVFSICEFSLNNTATVHTWIGYINGLNSLEDLSEYVYIAKNGTVYHRSKECSHIRLHINSVDGKDIKSLRNENGAKYKRCIYCHPKVSDPKLYVTSDGDKYHNSLNCSGLKRTVIRVRLSQIGDKTACLRCGY